jgi:Flp pilus assembly protein TadD
VVALETARRLNPRSGRILEQLGLALEAGGHTDQALDAYEQALKVDPAPSAHLNYGMLLYKLNRLEQSEEHLRRGRELDPHDWHACFELGKVYFRQQKFNDAVRELEAALKIRATGADQTQRILHLLGQVYLRMGREDDARRVLAAVAGAKP